MRKEQSQRDIIMSGGNPCGEAGLVLGLPAGSSHYQIFTILHMLQEAYKWKASISVNDPQSSPTSGECVDGGGRGTGCLATLRKENVLQERRWNCIARGKKMCCRRDGTQIIATAAVRYPGVVWTEINRCVAKCNTRQCPPAARNRQVVLSDTTTCCWTEHWWQYIAWSGCKGHGERMHLLQKQWKGLVNRMT